MKERTAILLLVLVFAFNLPVSAEIERFFQIKPYRVIIVSTEKLVYASGEAVEEEQFKSLYLNFSFRHDPSDINDWCFLTLGQVPSLENNSLGKVILATEQPPEILIYQGEEAQPLLLESWVNLSPEQEQLMVQFFIHPKHKKLLENASQITCFFALQGGKRLEFTLPEQILAEWQYILRADKPEEYRQARQEAKYANLEYEDFAQFNYTEAGIMQEMLADS